MASMNIVIDGNFITYHALFSILRYEPSLFKLDNYKEIFFKHILESIDFIYKKVNVNIDCTYIAFDDSQKSWRHQIVDNNRTFKYKDREKSDDLDMDKVNVIFNEFYSMFKSEGFYTIRGHHLEGDDWLGFIVNNSIIKDQSFIIVTSDSDIEQLVRSGENDNFAAIHSPLKKKFIFYRDEDETEYQTETLESDDAMDVFMNMDMSINSDLVNAKKMIISDGEPAVPSQGLFIKIVSGDATDTIPSVHHKLSKNGKKISFGKISAKNLYEARYDHINMNYFSNLWEDQKVRRKLAIDILTAAKCSDMSLVDTVEENILVNMRFIWLDLRVYDDNIRESAMKELLDLQSDQAFYNTHRLLYNHLGLIDLKTKFKNTPYDFTTRSYQN